MKVQKPAFCGGICIWRFSFSDAPQLQRSWAERPHAMCIEIMRFFLEAPGIQWRKLLSQMSGVIKRITDVRNLVILTLSLLILTACTLANQAPTVTTIAPIPSTETPPTPDTSSLPVVGEPGLEPSGAGPCVIFPLQVDTLIFAEANLDAQPIAVLGEGRGLVPFEYQANGGWYAVNFHVDNQAQVGWLPSGQTRLEGDCGYLTVPEVCSVRPSVGRNIDVYGEPRRDAPIVSVLGDQYSLPFVERTDDGWFGVDLGGGQTGWIAPDEGEQVGC
jgi:hypothetical protein